MIEDLAALQRTVDDFLHAAVHDIRGPLGQVRALAVLLARQHKTSLSADGQELCGLIEAASKRAVEVVESIHVFAGVLEAPVFGVTDLDAVVDSARFTLQGVIGENRGVITRDDLGSVQGDRSKLMLLFEELFRNALKFRGEAPPRIHCSIQHTADEYVVLSVTDNGAGIDQQDADLVFKPLKRLHGREYEGTGMGLAICRRIVEMHGGKIWVANGSAENGSQRGGAEFRFTLPNFQTVAT